MRAVPDWWNYNFTKMHNNSRTFNMGPHSKTKHTKPNLVITSQRAVRREGKKLRQRFSKSILSSTGEGKLSDWPGNSRDFDVSRKIVNA
jgi:hypothetical protein